MPYTNLVYLLLVIIILATRGVPDEPQLALGPALLLFALKAALFAGFSHYSFRRPGPFKAASYFATQQRLSILAIISFAFDIYLLDAQYYFAKLPAAAALPSLVPYAGVALFLSYLLVVWNRARPSYCRIFQAQHPPLAFIAANLKLNLVILLPWLLITLLADLLALTTFGPFKQLLASPWGEPLVIICFFLLLLFVFPWLATRLWDCRPLPDGPLRRRLEDLCRSHRVRFQDIMLWPLFEGRLLTAGVMGITRHFRYLLITPALLQALDDDELEAVIAHEIGHVRHHHLPIYFLFFVGFGLFAHLASLPFLIMLLDSGLLERAMAFSGKSPLAIINLAGTLALLALVIIYFRFLFGFFMRNFERQADLYALEAVGRAEPLIRVFEKIAWLGGKIRDLPSWHHFSIGQRIDYLAASDENPGLINKHHRKVRLSLVLFLLLLGSAAFTLWQLPGELGEEEAKARLVETIIQEKIRLEPDNPDWPSLLGDLHYLRGQYPEAIAAYEQSLLLAPHQPEILNNLAWLLLTAEDPAVHDYPRALELAREAVRLDPNPHILDTLATAWWQMGDREKAVAAARAALEAADPLERRYYQQQLQRFQRDELPRPARKEEEPRP